MKSRLSAAAVIPLACMTALAAPGGRAWSQSAPAPARVVPIPIDDDLTILVPLAPPAPAPAPSPAPPPPAPDPLRDVSISVTAANASYICEALDLFVDGKLVGTQRSGQVVHVTLSAERGSETHTLEAPRSGCSCTSGPAACSNPAFPPPGATFLLFFSDTRGQTTGTAQLPLVRAPQAFIVK